MEVGLLGRLRSELAKRPSRPVSFYDTHTDCIAAAHTRRRVGAVFASWRLRGRRAVRSLRGRPRTHYGATHGPGDGGKVTARVGGGVPDLLDWQKHISQHIAARDDLHIAGTK